MATVHKRRGHLSVLLREIFLKFVDINLSMGGATVMVLHISLKCDKVRFNRNN